MATGSKTAFQDMDLYCESLYIDGTQVTATAAEINAGVDGLTAPLPRRSTMLPMSRPVFRRSPPVAP